MLLFLLFLFLKNPVLTANEMRSGILLCARVVVPALFPCMVVSEMLMGVLVGGYGLPKFFTPLRRIFGVSDRVAVGICMGLLCGFPIGARALVSAYEDGELDKHSTECLLAVSSNPSPAFLIGVVGSGMFKSKRFGILLLVLLMLFQVMTWFSLRPFLSKTRKKEGSAACCGALEARRIGVSRSFINAIHASLKTVLVISAYILFFSVLGGVSEYMMDALTISGPIRQGLACLLELSSGCMAASEVGGVYGALLATFCVGWGGLCVHAQLLSMVEHTGLSLRPYLCLKAMQGLLCMLSVWLLLALFPARLP